MKKCLYAANQLETLEADRDAWRDVCDEGLAAFDVNWRQKPVDTESQASMVESGHLSLGCGVMFILVTPSTASLLFVTHIKQALMKTGNKTANINVQHVVYHTSSQRNDTSNTTKIKKW